MSIDNIGTLVSASSVNAMSDTDELLNQLIRNLIADAAMSSTDILLGAKDVFLAEASKVSHPEGAVGMLLIIANELDARGVAY